MNIIFFSSSATSSGGTRQALYSAQGLVKRGHKLLFLVPDTSTIINKDPNIDWITLPTTQANTWKSIFQNLCLKFRPDIIHAYHNKAIKKMAWWGLFFKKKKSVKILAHRGVVFPPRNPLPYWSPAIDCFTANSLACAKKIHALGVSWKKIKVIYNCLPPHRLRVKENSDAIRQRFTSDKNTLIIGTISGNAPVKGIAVFLKALALLKDLPIKVIVLGATKDKWKKMCMDLDILDKVYFLGYQENVAEYLQLMDVFCIPSLSESMPNTLLEAIFFELPIVASAVGGIPEVLQNKSMLFKPGSSQDLAFKLRNMCLNDNLRQKLRAEINPLKDMFFLETKINKLEALYNSLFARKF